MQITHINRAAAYRLLKAVKLKKFRTEGAEMFVMSAKITKGKVLVAALALCCIALVVIVAVAGNGGSVAANAEYVTKTNDERVDFLKDFGWEVESDPVSVSDIVIPTNFDATYDTYNNIQLAQGLDLSGYKGEKAVKYTYKVTNYPDNADTVNANLIVVGETIVAGDVSSTSLGGFMHGFAKPASVLAREAEAMTTSAPNIDLPMSGK